MKPNHALNKVFKGTEFQKKVWNYVKTIKKGSVMTYKQVAIGINRPKSARAVANAAAIVDLIDMIVYYYLARALKNPADDSTPDMEYLTLTQGYDLSIPLYNIYLY